MAEVQSFDDDPISREEALICEALVREIRYASRWTWEFSNLEPPPAP